MRKIFHIILIFLFSQSGFSQQTLSLKSAIDSALKNNFDIQIAKNNVEISKANNSYGVAGGLPIVAVTAGDQESFSDINQKLSSGSEINKKGVAGNNFNAGVNASMTLFNGFKIVATRERLKLLQSQSELQLNQQIQNTIAAIMAKYFDIIRQIGYLKIIQASLDVSKQKSEIVNARKNAGMTNDADVLQVQIDANTAEQNIKSQQIIINLAKTDLQQLMNVKNFNSIEINDTIIPDKNLKLDSVLVFLQKNPQYLSAEQQVKINEQIIKEISALRYPSVKINTGYNLSLAQSDAGQVLYNQNLGPSIGITLNIPIFNGNIYKTQKQTATYNVANARLQQESVLNILKTNAIKTWQSYANTLQQIESQKTNNDMALKLVNTIMKRFQVNQSTIIDVKTAQASLENTSYQLINLQYAAKIAEIELKRIMYKLEN